MLILDAGIMKGDSIEMLRPMDNHLQEKGCKLIT